MASYKVLIKPSAVKELEALPSKDRRKILPKIGTLETEPRPHRAEKVLGQDRYRVRRGDYRVVYSIDDRAPTVLVVKMGHRRDIHR